MFDMKPHVSVCLRVFNGERFLEEAIASILCQTFSDFELIVLNDGSTDRTREIVESFRDSRIRLVNRPNTGLTRATIAAVDCARGRYIAIMDADDIAEPERIAIQIRAFEADPQLVMVGSNVTIIDARGQRIASRSYPISDETIRSAVIAYNPCAHPTMMFRSGALRACGSYSTRFETVEDYDLYFRLLRHGKALNIQKPLLRYRLHSSSVKSARTKLQLRETIILRKLASEEYGWQPTRQSRLIDVAQRFLMAVPSVVVVRAFHFLAYRRGDYA